MESAVLPILLFIGMVIGAQAFQATPRRHAPAVILALIPNIAEWARTQVDGAFGAVGTDISQVDIAALNGNGVIYEGMAALGGGAVLAGLMLAAIAVFIIERRFNWAAVYAFAAAMLSYFGFIHGHQLAINASPEVTFGYFAAGVVLAYLAWKEVQDGQVLNWSPTSDDDD